VSSLDLAVVWLGSGVCSQNPAHSFWIGGRPLPMCARDLGLFGALGLTLPFARGPHRMSWLWLLAPLLLDGANSFASEALGLGLYEPTNPLRLLTGALAGIALALVLPPGRATAVGLAAGAALLPFAPWLGLGVLGLSGALGALAAANLLARPLLARQVAWVLTIPEIALLAAGKAGLLALLR
jgi:uncharacterized membrane protein